jgi:tRNA-dihydrouridine synthase
MDGVTDAAYRFMAAKLGHPALMFTEFTAVEGLRAGADRLLEDFYYHPIERPVIAQLFGSDPDAFFLGAVIVSALGFDGIDINMGCPAKNVTERGAGAALIRDPERARAIIAEARAGTKAWAEGGSLEELGVHPRLIPLIENRRAYTEKLEGITFERKELPVSVKTRIGYDSIIIKDWIKELLETDPVAITIHGRTLKQLYTGFSDWEAIADGVKAGAGTNTLFLGNGDVLDYEDGLQRSNQAGTNGFLIGRHAIGNPWIFAQHIATPQERQAAALEHARYLDAIFEGKGFVRIRKHLLEYTKGCQGARDVRLSLSKLTTLADVENLLTTVQW